MNRFLYPLLAIALVPPLAATAQILPQPMPRPPSQVSNLANAIANGAQFVVQLRPGADNGTLIGGETYVGTYDRFSGTFTVSGRGLRWDGAVIQLTSTDGGGDPLRQQLSLWGAGYTFDAQGNVFLNGSPVGRIWLRQ